jgi:putative aminopeptidase FrvX
VPVPPLLDELLRAPGPSGAEERPAAVWRAAASGFAEVSSDTLGTSVARVAGTAGGPSCALIGHMDEIGFIATHLDEQGYVAIRRVGGYNPEVLVGQRVEFLSGVRGVVARRREQGAPGERKPARIEDLHVDVGARDAGEAGARVRPGDVGVFAAEPLELSDGRLASRALDNRLGCYVALEAARRVAGEAPGDVVAIAATQEETGAHGVRSAVFGLEPELALVFDVTSASDVPGADPRDDGKHELGSGATILRGTIIHPRISDLLVESAEAEGIPYTIEVAGGASRTDADATHLSRAGIPTGLVSIPLRYMHSAIELCDLGDVEATIRLAVAFLRRLQPGLSFAR